MLDQDAGWAYAPVAQQSILSYGGRYLAAGPTPEPIEGRWNSSRLLLLEFPDTARIREWYDSPEYRRARQIRKDKAEVSLLFLEGSPPEGFTLPA